MARMWVLRGLGACVLALIGAGAWAALNWDSLQTHYATHRLTSATTEDERAKWADALACREGGPEVLVRHAADGESPVRAASVAALGRHFEAIAPADARGAELAVQLLDAFAACKESGRESLVELLPAAVQRAGVGHSAKCRSAVAAALKLPAASARVAAIRAAALPQVAIRNEIVPLLSAPEPEVRRAALFAVGPATDGDPVIGDEELFRWLHDPDADVRTICRAALVSRGRSDAEIGWGKRLVDPDANERLSLLLDLRFDDELPDVEPWLERLSHDADPAVRAGTARVMMEINRERKLAAPEWVNRLTDRDPSPTVRRVAGFYRSSNTPSDPGIRLIEGP